MTTRIGHAAEVRLSLSLVVSCVTKALFEKQSCLKYAINRITRDYVMSWWSRYRHRFVPWLAVHYRRAFRPQQPIADEKHLRQALQNYLKRMSILHQTMVALIL